MPDITPVALSIQPAPSIGPTLSSLTQLGIQQTQLARQNALYGALAGGDPNEIAKWDPSMATAEVGYQKASRAFDAWKQYGAAAAAGDPQAQAALGARDPESLKILTAIASDRQGIAASAQKMGYDTFDQATKATNALGTQLLAIAGEPDPAKRAAAIPTLIAQAKRIPGATDDQILPVAKALQIASDPKASPEDQNRALDVVAHVGKVMFASSADAQAVLAKSGFGTTTLDPNAPQVIPGAAQAAMGFPLQNNPLGAAAGVPQAPPPAAAAPPALAPAAGPPPDAGASSLAAGPGATFSGLPTPDSGGATPPGLPSPAASAPAAGPPPPIAPIPAAPAAAAPAPALPTLALGLPASRTASGALVTGGGPAYAEGEKQKAMELADAGSMTNLTKQIDMQNQTGAMLGVLKSANLQTGLGSGDFLQLQKAQQTLYSILGVNDPALNETINTKESFTKFATLAAAQIAKQDVGARVTNFDLQTFLRNQPGLDTSLQGNMRLLGVVDQVQSRNVDLARLAQQYRASGDWQGWTKATQAYQDAHPIVDPGNGQVLSTSSDNSYKRGEPISVTPAQLQAGVLDNTYHLLPGAQVSVGGKTFVYAGAPTGKPGVTGAALPRPAPASIVGAPALPTFGGQ